MEAKDTKAIKDNKSYNKGMKSKVIKLPPEVNRFVFVKNLPSKITADELYDIFSKFGPVQQIRKGALKSNKGKVLVVYYDILDSKKCVEKLSGVKVLGNYLICHYYQNKK